MDVKNFVGLLVFGVIGVIVLAAFVPIISETTSATKTFQNDGYVRYSSIDSTDDTELVITWDYTNPKYISVNDTEIDVSAYSGMWASIVFGEQWTVRYNYNATNTQLQYFGQTNADFVYAYESSSLNLTVTLNQGTVTVTNGTLTKTASYTTAYYPDPSGSMIMKKSDKDCYLLEDSSVIIANGTTYSNPYTVGIFFEGTVGDGLEFELFRNLDDFAVSNVVIHSTPNSDYIGLIEVEKVTFDLTPGENPSFEATYSYFLVPYEVTAEKAIHPDDALSAVIDLLPLIAGIGLLIILVGEFLYRRYL